MNNLYYLVETFTLLINLIYLLQNSILSLCLITPCMKILLTNIYKISLNIIFA